MKHVREAARLFHQSTNQEHGRLFERHAPPDSSEIPYVSTVEEIEVASTHHRRLAELRNHSSRRALSALLEQNLFVDQLRVQDIPRSLMHKRIVDDVDWIAIADTVRSAVTRTQPDALRSRGRVDEEAPPNEESQRAGIGYLAPTASRAMRTLGYVMRHGHPPIGNNLYTRSSLNIVDADSKRTPSPLDPSWMDDGALDPSTSRRRLCTGLFDGTLLVPHSQTTQNIQNTTAGIIEEIGSYMIYNVFLVSFQTQ